MMTAGVNVKTGCELGTLGPLRPEQFSYPPASAVIGGAAYGSLAGPLPPFRGAILAGMIGTVLVKSVPSVADEHAWPTIHISVTPGTYLVPDANITEVGLREAYEELRRQMVSEGIPFLNAAELEREIAERKGTRY